MVSGICINLADVAFGFGTSGPTSAEKLAFDGKILRTDVNIGAPLPLKHSESSE